jgi:hypothetical protein
MKKILMAMAALGAIAAAAPASAQYANANANVNAGGAVGIDNRIARIEQRIQAGIQAGTISRTEARDLRLRLRDIRRLDYQYGRNGYTQAERRDMQARLRAFREQLQMADGRRGNGQYGAYDDRYDDDYDNDGNYGQGGPYEAVECDSRGNGNSGGGVLGGIFDSIFGGSRDDRDCDATLRVGQRASGNLSAVPYEYRNQFRDGNGIVYRTDGRVIYQIDVRTGRVLRIYDVDR